MALDRQRQVEDIVTIELMAKLFSCAFSCFNFSGFSKIDGGEKSLAVVGGRNSKPAHHNGSYEIFAFQTALDVSCLCSRLCEKNWAAARALHARLEYAQMYDDNLGKRFSS